MLDATVMAALPTAKREPDVVVYLPGPPQGKGMPRATVGRYGKMAGKAFLYPHTKTKNYEAIIRYVGEKAMAGRHIFDCMLRCRVTAVFAVPQSKPQRWKAEALAGIIRPTVKPDDDNLLKVRDGLKGVVFRDDSLFVESTVRKFYGESPCWQIEIWQHTSLLL